MSKTNNGLSLKETIRIAGQLSSDSFNDIEPELVEYTKSDAEATRALYESILEMEQTLENQLGFYYDKESVTLKQGEAMLNAFEMGYLTQQYDKDGNMYLNPNGIVTRAEVINALSTDGDKQNSIDGVSDSLDYYNKGYNELVKDGGSNFYKVYERTDLDLNIRRFELAYMIASHDKYLFGKSDQLELSIPDLYNYEDIKSLPMVLGSSNSISNLLPQGKDSIEDYINKVRTGKVKLPLDIVLLTSNLMKMVGSQVELTSLHPLKGVSRLEFALIMKTLAVKLHDCK